MTRDRNYFFGSRYCFFRKKFSEKLINDTYLEHGALDEWKISELTHEFPEWEQLKSGSKRILLQNLLNKAGEQAHLSADEIKEIHDRLLLIEEGNALFNS